MVVVDYYGTREKMVDESRVRRVAMVKLKIHGDEENVWKSSGQSLA